MSEAKDWRTQTAVRRVSATGANSPAAMPARIISSMTSQKLARCRLIDGHSWRIATSAISWTLRSCTSVATVWT